MVKALSGTCLSTKSNDLKDVLIFGTPKRQRILVFIASTAILGLCVLHHGFSHRNRLNLKYASIEYGGHQKRLSEPSFLSVMDEKGNALGGKKAAIQFAHDLQKMKNEEQDIINRLSMILSKKINNNAQPVEPLDVENIKKVQQL